MDRCLRCYGELANGENSYHTECADTLFGDIEQRVVLYTMDQLRELSEDEVRHIPLSIFEPAAEGSIQPTSERAWSSCTIYPDGGHIANLTMLLAQAAHIVTAPHGLVRLTSGELYYMAKRVEIGANGELLPMEDICQISELSFEERYEGQYEEVMELIEEYSSVNRIDVVTLWEQVVFAWICGNSDFNLKHIALYEPYKGICSLAPLKYATSTALSNSDLLGTMALSINGKRSGVKRADIERAMRESGLKMRAINIIFKKFVAAKQTWFELIDSSPIDEELKDRYKKLLENQLKQLEVLEIPKK